MLCTNLHFHLPQEYQANGVTSIRVAVPNACIGTGIYKPQTIFYALMEEIIRWLTGLNPGLSLIRMHPGQSLVRSDSSSHQQTRNAFQEFITSMRDSNIQLRRLGSSRNSFGMIDLALVPPSSEDISVEFIITLTLANRLRMSLILSRDLVDLPQDWILDWLEVQNELSSPVDAGSVPISVFSQVDTGPPVGVTERQRRGAE